MKREFRDENFEEFLKRNADNFRMKAPERVWENLSSQLNKKRNRFARGLSAFFLLAGLLGYLAISTTIRQVHLTDQQANSAQQTTASVSAEQRSGSDGNAVTQQAKTPFRRNEVLQSETMNRIENPSSASLSFADEVTVAEKGEQPAGNQFTSTIIDDNPQAVNSAAAETQQTPKPAFLLSHNATPWSIESVTNTYHRKKSRFRTEFHFTPTISYRKLSENKSYLHNTPVLNSPPNYAALYGSINNMVTHKPDLGFELGVTEKYSLSKKLRIRAGLQFNVNRYDIKAFTAPYAVATIALKSRYSSRVDSVRTMSNYSNVDGSSNKSNWLQNFSFQVSAPVGAEFVLKGNEKMQFGIATTVQPTYVLGDRSYLITNDYKKYTQVPWLLRRWNVNTAFETFVSYQSGKTRWQVGPQVRYQLLSSFISNYPVKENLFDFGLKIGLSVNK